MTPGLEGELLRLPHLIRFRFPRPPWVNASWVQAPVRTCRTSIAPAAGRSTVPLCRPTHSRPDLGSSRFGGQYGSLVGRTEERASE